MPNKSPMVDKALEAMIAERFHADEPAGWRPASDALRRLFAHWEHKLPTHLWTALCAGLDMARDSGDCYPLIEAATLCQIELRRVAHDSLVARARRKSSSKLKAAPRPDWMGEDG